MARPGCHSSDHHRHAIEPGITGVIWDPATRLKLTDRFTGRICPRRPSRIRQPDAQVFKTTTMMGMEVGTHFRN
jgi:hypothetical protein